MSTLATRKKEFLKILKNCLGIVKTAADKYGMDRSVHYKWMKSDPKYKKSVDDIEQEAVDFAESKLFELIRGVELKEDKLFQNGRTIIVQPTIKHYPPDTAATIFYLKTKGKARGYVEKQEVEHSGDSITSFHITMDQIPKGEELPSDENQIDLTRDVKK